MTDNPRFLLIIVLCLLPFFYATPGPATAGEGTVLGTGQFKKIFTEMVLADAVWPAKDLQVNGFSAWPESLMIPAGIASYRLMNQTHSSYLGKKTLNVAVLVNGKEYAQVRMNGDLQLYGEVVCLSRPVPRHTVLSPDDLLTTRQNISMLGADLLRESGTAVGKRLKSSLQGGALLFQHLLEEPPLVKRGDRVTILAQSQRFRVTVPGEVREPGTLGELVQVKNLMSRRVIFAKVVDAGHVEVNY